MYIGFCDAVRLVSCHALTDGNATGKAPSRGERSSGPGLDYPLELPKPQKGAGDLRWPENART